MSILEIKSLVKEYSGNVVLDHINFKFDTGNVYGIVGNNGVGKTTLLKCLTKSISYKGDILHNDNITFGYLPDNLFFYSKTTGIEYLEFFISARSKKPDSDKINRLNNVFELPLNTKYTSEYSAGMKKKLGFLAILLQDNDFYVLDEPFNNLDIKTVMEFQKIICLLAQRKKIVIISSHILDPIKNICNSISILSDGKFVNTFEKENFHLVDCFFKETICNSNFFEELI